MLSPAITMSFIDYHITSLVLLYFLVLVYFQLTVNSNVMVRTVCDPKQDDDLESDSSLQSVILMSKEVFILHACMRQS